MPPDIEFQAFSHIASNRTGTGLMGFDNTLTLPVPVIIVSYKNPDDLLECLSALSLMAHEPAFDIYVCETGGAAAFEDLCNRVSAKSDMFTASDAPPPCAVAGFGKVQSYLLEGALPRLTIGLAHENLGYGGGVNAWLRPLAAAADWPGAFILNPDAAPTPDALRHLMSYAQNNRRGMVTGRIVLTETPEFIQTRGLRWNPWRASNISVDRHARSDLRPDPARIEGMIDSPSGAAIYVSRMCLNQIGFMKETYFLYYEDVDWGMRAKSACGLGYAFDAVVYHKGGTTIGGGSRRTAAPLSVFLEFRNRLLFVSDCKRGWLPWTLVISLIRALEFALVGRPMMTRVALRGIFEGLVGRDGRPDHILSTYRARSDRATSAPAARR